MVRRGQFLERAVIIPGEPTLEGLYHRGTGGGGILIVPPHPERGGSMEGPIVAELAWALTRAGHPTLRFNYRGVGASQGGFDAEAVAFDVERAAEHLSESLDPAARALPLGFVGLGWGGRFARPLVEAGRVDTVVWVMPDDPQGLARLAGLTVEVIAVMPQETERATIDAVKAQTDALKHGRWSIVAGADGAFRRGLVDLGKGVVTAFSALAHP